VLEILPGYRVAAVLLAAIQPGHPMSWRLSVRVHSVNAARLLISHRLLLINPLARSNLTSREAKPEITERSSLSHVITT
jgi:hypothetical protein